MYSAYLLPQNELVERFNAAFYEAQQPEPPPPPPPEEEKAKLPLDDEILESFDESYFTNIDAYENYFDYTDLSENLDEVLGVEDEQFSSFFVPPPFVEQLPPISSITRSNNTDFANFLRNMPCDSLDLFADVSDQWKVFFFNKKSDVMFFREIFKVIMDTFLKTKQQIRTLECFRYHRKRTTLLWNKKRL